jgi:hypothetical protein
MLTPSQRALLQGVAIPDLALSQLPPAKLLQVNSPELLDSPDNPSFVEGAIAGGFVVPTRDGRIFLPRYHFGIFGWGREFAEFEPRVDGNDQFVESHAEMPKDAFWRGENGKKVCRRGEGDDGNIVREVITCFQRCEETGQMCRFNFSKTALRIGRELANSSQRLTLEGEQGVKGAVLGRYSMASRLERKDTRRWYAPVPTLLGKLGQKDGPSLETVLALAELRQAFKQGLPTALDPPAPPPPPPPTAPSLGSPLDLDDGPPLDDARLAYFDGDPGPGDDDGGVPF